ncbi:MAG: hypothetical protein KJ936_13355 [Proteobacteria bacterium]|nr:hypothetical protein [Pseudomonadota bacterium]MBU2228627.1 hypothetical protein [Pseudomonadota bacterium]MBU2262941.1 hypothetical protein [Pseudomonadota bacterium]
MFGKIVHYAIAKVQIYPSRLTARGGSRAASSLTVNLFFLSPLDHLAQKKECLAVLFPAGGRGGTK